MRYLLFIFILLSSAANAQIRDFQLLGKNPHSTLFIMGTQTDAMSTKYGLGKWYNGDSLVDALVGSITSFSVEEDNASTSTGVTTIDFGTYFDKSFSTPEADIVLDMTEAQIDGAPENDGSEYLLVEDADTTAGKDIQRFRLSALNGTMDHGLLAGLPDDDHTQYALLAGRTSGQVLTGGTTTTADLSFKITSGVGTTGADMHFLVGNNGATEPMTILNNGNVGVGTTSPSAMFHIIDIVEPLRIGYDGSNYYTTILSTVAGVTFDATGTTPSFMFSDKMGVSANGATPTTLMGKDASNFFSPMAIGSILDINSGTLDIDFGEATLVSILELTDDQVMLWDDGSSGGVANERITIADFINEIETEISVTGDGNGFFDGANDGGTIPSGMNGVLTNNFKLGDGSDNDLYVDGSGDKIGMGTASPQYGLHIVNGAGLAVEGDATGQNVVAKIEGTADGGSTNTAESTLQFNYTDADYASAVEQSGMDMTLHKEVDDNSDQQWTTFKMDMKENTDADVFVAEKNAEFSNTTESHVAINAGMAYTQNFDISTSGDLSLDRSYYTLNVTGGSLTDTIKLPEVASTSDNWAIGLTFGQCQVGQEYVISNFRSATNLVVSAYNSAGTGSDDLIDTQTQPVTAAGSAMILLPNESVIVKCVRLASGIGYWYTYN